MKHMKSMMAAVFLFSTTSVFAHNPSPVEFYASNNTGEITLQTAYDRLTGKEQINLQNKMINLLQKHHIEQGRFEDSLGTYRMSTDQHITADNTDIFSTSPYQHLSDDTVFALAKKLAILLNQDSIALFISDKSSLGNITVNFTSHKPTIDEVTTLVHDKLPALYNQAFSIHLANTCGRFNDAKVASIEWLGSKLNIEDIKTAFPSEKISSRNGKVYLVYQNGQKEQL